MLLGPVLIGRIAITSGLILKKGRQKNCLEKIQLKKKVDGHCGGITRWSPLSPGSEPSKVASKEKQFLSLFITASNAVVYPDSRNRGAVSGGGENLISPKEEEKEKGKK